MALKSLNGIWNFGFWICGITNKMFNEQLDVVHKWAILVRYNKYYDSITGKLEYGAMKKITKECGVSESTIQNVVSQYRAEVEKGNYFPDLTPKFNERGRKPREDKAERLIKLEEINQRTKGKLSLRQLLLAMEKEGFHMSLRTLQTDMLEIKGNNANVPPDSDVRKRQLEGGDGRDNSADDSLLKKSKRRKTN